MYRIIPLRILRCTSGVMFDEMVPSDIPKISGIDRIISGIEGSISVNFATRTNKIDIYNLCTNSGDYQLLRDGINDQPDLSYKYTNEEIKKKMFKE